MRTLIYLLSLLLLAACSSPAPSPPQPTEDATTTATEPATEPSTPPLSIEELLAAMPNEPLPPDPESLTRAQRDGQSVAAKQQSAPTEPATKQSTPLEAAPSPDAEKKKSATAKPPENDATISPTPAAQPVVSRTSASPTTETPVVATSSELSVESASVAKEVVDRQPRGQGPFTDGGTVWTWNRILNPGGKKRTVRHIYYREGKQIVVVPLAIGGASWRTWSHTRIQGAGQWRVDIVDEQSVVLKSLPFEVK